MFGILVGIWELILYDIELCVVYMRICMRLCVDTWFNIFKSVGNGLV